MLQCILLSLTFVFLLVQINKSFRMGAMPRGRHSALKAQESDCNIKCPMYEKCSGEWREKGRHCKIYFAFYQPFIVFNHVTSRYQLIYISTPSRLRWYWEDTRGDSYNWLHVMVAN